MTAEDELAALRAEVARLNAILEEGLSVRDLELKIRDGSIAINSIFGETAGGSPVVRFFAAMMLNLLLGEDNEEPPNYRSFCFDITPAGEPTMRFYGEVIKPGGRSSHEIRQDLEARLAELTAAGAPR
ncbi:MAG TPA: hypothetical protein VHD87_15415 [Acidimicrobiales bacterium]|nr:hypothetical protein [Acidimicrobiales bacterium]